VLFRSRRSRDVTCRKALVAVVLGLASCSPSALAQQQYQSLADVPLGCYVYGYVYDPEMANVTGQPFTTSSAMVCQERCAATPGCARFGWWSANTQCWLGGAEAVAKVSKSLGAIAGPARCMQEAVTCSESDIPTANFPGATAAISRAAWASGQEPTNLQCWPRKANGFPATCISETATVLQDTLQGWPGRCEGLQTISNLGPTETCQSRCFGSPLCGVWAEENSTSGDGSLTCWAGMFGQQCYNGQNGLSPPPGSYFRSQRVMHGTFRVLMNTAGMQIGNLTRAFGVELHPNWEEGAKACRMTCLSHLLCQFWQYTDVYGCWVEDDMTSTIGYPMVNDGVMMNTNSYSAKTVKAGEFIQHICKPGPPQPLPTDPPMSVAGVLVTTPKPTLAMSQASSTTVDVSVQKPFPLWATMLICVTIALCLGVIGAAGWMSMLDADKMGSKGSMRGIDMGIRPPGGYAQTPGNSRTQSFDSQQPLMHGGTPGMPPPDMGWNAWGHAQLQGLHFGGHPAQPPPAYGYPGHQPDPRYAGMTTQNAIGPSRNQLMQYAHQGY